MTERQRPSGPRGLDRVSAPDPVQPRRSDVQGKRALYSVDPEANPTPVLLVKCPRCDVQRGITANEARGLFRPPFLVSPFFRHLWTRCPTCSRRTWLRVRRGPGIPWPF